MMPWAAPPIAVERSLAPFSFWQPEPGLWVFDFGANLAGVVQFTHLICREGTNLTISHGEILQHAAIPGIASPDPARIYTANLRTARQTDVYICAGPKYPGTRGESQKYPGTRGESQKYTGTQGGNQEYLPTRGGSSHTGAVPGTGAEANQTTRGGGFAAASDTTGEDWCPRLAYHGFRYAEIRSSDPDLFLDGSHVRLLHLHSAVQKRSQVFFSSGTLNRLQAMAEGAQRSNLMSLPTDCPQRDERLGWLGDASLSGESIALNFDAGALLSGFVENIVDEMGEDGSLPAVAPSVSGCASQGREGEI
jgi:hypothetical protein